MDSLKKKLFLLIVFIVSFVSVAQANLAKEVNGIIGRSSQRKVQFSIHIIKADSGETVYSHEAAKAMIPASNMKVIVTAAALKYLGPNYEYKTKVGLRGNTLVIIGSGDPLLGDEVTDTNMAERGTGYSET